MEKNRLFVGFPYMYVKPGYDKNCETHGRKGEAKSAKKTVKNLTIVET